MFCPNCGKQIKGEDNFCIYCGTSLKSDGRISSYIEQEYDKEIDKIREEQSSFEVFTELNQDENIENQDIFDTEEELVLYEVNKHWMSLFWPAFLTPIFLVYFWTIFLTTRGFFSFFVIIAMLGFIIYPIARFKSDRMVITNKFAHIKIGIRDIKEIDISINKFDTIDVTQTEMGKILGYGSVNLYVNSIKYEYQYIDSPEYLKRILDNPKKYI